MWSIRSILLPIILLSVLFISAATNNFYHIDVPVLSISCTSDPNNYLRRLLFSIDYPVRLILITIGNQEVHEAAEYIVKHEVKPAERHLKNLFPRLKVKATIITENPGSVYAFNQGIKYMLNDKEEFSSSWVLVVNLDIAFYPGTLREIAQIVNYSSGIGFTSLCCGAEWSAVVFHAEMVRQLGVFDENFYPAYYEDLDYGIRVALSKKHRAYQIPNSHLMHGKQNGSREYLSGVFDELFLHPNTTNIPPSIQRRDILRRGMEYGSDYIKRKWGISSNFHCTTMNDINKGICHENVVYKHPFNKSHTDLKFWKFDQAGRQKIVFG